MSTYTRHSYTLHISEVKKDRILDHKTQNGEVVNFSSPVTDKKRPKLYIIRSDEKVLYVGFTIQSIGTRMSIGFRADGATGYHGYKWDVYDEVELLIWVFDETFTGDQKIDKARKDFYEAVEAELVFSYRQQEKDWPECQNEIHFNNTSRTEVLDLAKKIYSELME